MIGSAPYRWCLCHDGQSPPETAEAIAAHGYGRRSLQRTSSFFVPPRLVAATRAAFGTVAGFGLRTCVGRWKLIGVNHMFCGDRTSRHERVPCQDLSLLPKTIILLENRHGWRPLPSRLMPRIARRCVAAFSTRTCRSLPLARGLRPAPWAGDARIVWCQRRRSARFG